MLVLDATSSLRVEGRLVIQGTESAPVLVQGKTDRAIITVHGLGRVHLQSVRLVDVNTLMLVEHTGMGDLSLTDVVVRGGQLASLVGGGGTGTVRLVDVQATGAVFTGPVFDFPAAALIATRVLLADLKAVSPLVRASEADLAFWTVADIEALDLLLFDVEEMEVQTSVLWPGSAYLGSRPDARVSLAESTVQGGWGQFYGTSALEQEDGRRVHRVSDAAPVFAGAAQDPYRLQPGTPGTDVVPRRQSIDADGSAADLGAYGGGRRALGTTIAVGGHISVYETYDLATLNNLYPEQGTGASLSIERELSGWLAVRARIGGFRTTRPRRDVGTLSEFGTIVHDTYTLVDVAVAGLIQVPATARLILEIGPQVTTGRAQIALSPDIIAAYQRAEREVVPSISGPGIRLDLVTGARLRLAGESGLHASLDLPGLPAGKWGAVSTLRFAEDGRTSEEIAVMPQPRIQFGFFTTLR